MSDKPPITNEPWNAVSAFLFVFLVMVIGGSASALEPRVWLPIALILSVVAAYLSYAGRRRANTERYRRRNRMCHHCGYDLRASHDKCPECGLDVIPFQVIHPIEHFAPPPPPEPPPPVDPPGRHP